jgi:hypothetical protein
LHLPEGVDELLDEPKVRAQPPEQEKQQQGYQGDYYQILQIDYSAVMGRLVMRPSVTNPRPGAG